MFIRSLKITISAMRANIGKSLLTMLGIVIGIMLITLVMSAGAAIEAFVVGQIEAFGSDIISTEVRAPGLGNSPNGIGVVVTTMKESDARAIAQIPNINEVYAGFLSQAPASKDGVRKAATLFGVNASYFSIDDAPLAEGRFFTEDENKSMARVVVLGANMAEKFFPDGGAPGQNIRIKSANYKVVGVIDSRGASSGFFDKDDFVVMPLTTLQKQIAGVDYVSFIISELVDLDRADETKAEIEELIRRRHKITNPDKDDFAVFTIDQAIEMIDIVIVGLQVLLIALASISLLVGGVGIMNIMYVSVSERTYEIGLRKAVGARNKDILMQFLVESSTLTLVGGIGGIIVGLFLSYLISVVATSKGYDWQFIVTPFSLIFALGFSVFVGMVFGLYPARKASKLEPITALRYE